LRIRTERRPISFEDRAQGAQQQSVAEQVGDYVLYRADGQMLDEVYNYGSFKQSKMFAAGVTCSDCHEPHGATLRAPGDGVCLQCHSPDKYAAVPTAFATTKGLRAGST